MFDDDGAALFAEEASSAPTPSYLVSCDIATFPAPQLHYTSVELVTIRFHI